MNYLQSRVKDLVGELALRKALTAKIPSAAALVQTHAWIKDQIDIDTKAVTKLSADDCKAVVAFLHKQRQVKKT